MRGEGRGMRGDEKFYGKLTMGRGGMARGSADIIHG